MKKIVVAGGCFWGVEAYYAKLKGIVSTQTGYVHGKLVDPSYQEVYTGTTDFVEAVALTYNEEITLEKILEHLFRFVDPTSLNKQGEDVGSQYRTGVYYESVDDQLVALNYIQRRQKEFQQKIAIEVKKLDIFYLAEEYHQKYLDKNPSGYCHVNFNLIKEEEKKASVLQTIVT